MKELELIFIQEVSVPGVVLDVFDDKKELKKELLSIVSFNNELGELSLPYLNEQENICAASLKTKKRFVHPNGFRLIDYDITYSMLGCADVVIKASHLERMDKDRRNPSVKVLAEVSVHFVFEEKMGKWYEVDLTNENHVSTKLYLEKKEQEKELEKRYLNEYNDHLKLLSKMEDIEYRYQNESEIKAIFDDFRAYHSILPATLDMYHFFKCVTPVEKRYLKKYSAAVLRIVNDAEESLFNELKEHGVVFETVFNFNKELKEKIEKALNEIRLFFFGRKDKNIDNRDLWGYRPTLYFIDELKERRELIPTVMEIETRRYFETDFWSDRDEREYLENLKRHAFGATSGKKEDEETPTEFLSGPFEKYEVTKEIIEEMKQLTEVERKKEFILRARSLEIPVNEYMNDFGMFTKLFKEAKKS